MKNVTVTYHRDDGRWWVDSEDLSGFTAVGNSFQEVRKLAHEGVSFYLDDAAHFLREKLGSGAVIVSGPTSISGFVASHSEPTTTWSGGLVTALNPARRMIEIGKPQFA